MNQRERNVSNKTIRVVAWLDMVITLPFALPFVAGALIEFIHFADEQLGLGTPAATFEFGPISMMFVHITGVLGVIWALARLRFPLPELARIDAIARLAVALLITLAIVQGATPLLGLFVLTEIGGSISQRRFLTTRSTSQPS